MRAAAAAFGDYAAYVEYVKAEKVHRNANFHAVVYKDWPAEKLASKLDVDGQKLLRIVIEFDASVPPLSHMQSCRIPPHFYELRSVAEMTDVQRADKLVEGWVHRSWKRKD